MILMGFEILAISLCCAIFFNLGYKCGQSNEKQSNNDDKNNITSTDFDSDLSKILNYTGDRHFD